MAILVTGAAGFIGFHVTRALLDRGERVLGLDNLNSYYDPALKRARLARLEESRGFTFRPLDVAHRGDIAEFGRQHPEVDRIVHLAAQAGVRHALDHPFDYIDANVIGQLTVLEFARHLPRVENLVYAS